MKKGPARKKIEPLEVEIHLNGLMARWSEMYGKQALQLLKIAESYTKSQMQAGTVQQLKNVTDDLNSWCDVYLENTKDWQRLKTYVRVTQRNAAQGTTGDLFAALKVQAQSVSKPKQSANTAKKVGRSGITYAQVSNAIDELTVSGINPTIQSIRTHLGTGSPNTIHRHLTAWRSAAPVVERSIVDLPEQLKADILKLQTGIVLEIEKQAVAARATAEKELISMNDESDILSKAGEQLEAENERLELENAELTTDVAAAATLAAEHDKQITNLKTENSSLQSSNSELTQQLATAQAQLAMQQEQFEQQQQQFEKQLAEAEAAKQQAAQSQQVAAVAVAKEEAAVEAKLTAIKQADALQQQLTAQQAAAAKKMEDFQQQLTQQQQQAAKKLDDLQQQLTAQQTAALVALQQQLNTQTKTVKKPTAKPVAAKD